MDIGKNAIFPLETMPNKPQISASFVHVISSMEGVFHPGGCGVAGHPEFTWSCRCDVIGSRGGHGCQDHGLGGRSSWSPSSIWSSPVTSWRPWRHPPPGPSVTPARPSDVTRALPGELWVTHSPRDEKSLPILLTFVIARIDMECSDFGSFKQNVVDNHVQNDIDERACTTIAWWMTFGYFKKEGGIYIFQECHWPTFEHVSIISSGKIAIRPVSIE